MAINNPNCNAFTGKVSLSRTSSPNSTLCSGIQFNNNSLQTETISHAKDGTKYPVLNFMEVRQNGTLDNELCLLPTYGNITYELISCKNRFGGALFRETGKIGPQYERISYDERCVGYKTLNSNIFLTNTWQDEHVLYFSGIPQETLTLINGPCISGELAQEYVINASASNCGGKLPCAELRRLVCKFDGSAATNPDITCAITNEIPQTLFQNNFFCGFKAASLSRLIYGFCSINGNLLRGNIQEVRFCEVDNENIRFHVDEFKYCSINGQNLRAEIEEIKFCSIDTIFIRDEIEVSTVKYCSYNRENINYKAEEAYFCDVSSIILELKFCSGLRP